MLFCIPRNQSVSERAEHRDRCSKQHAEWQRPAFVKRSENQEHEQERHSKHDSRRHALLRFLFLKRDAEIIVAHLFRHGLPKNFFQRVHRLIRAVAGRGGTVDLCGAIFVVAQREFRTGDVFDGRDGIERHGVAVRIANEELPHILRIGAVIAFRLDVNLPGSAEPIEIVHEKSAHERLQRLIYLVEIDSLLDHFVAIDVDENLRHVR